MILFQELGNFEILLLRNTISIISFRPATYITMHVVLRQIFTLKF